MRKVAITKSTLDFLYDLSRNNNRDWFAKNKDRYLRENENMIAFADNLLNAMRNHDYLETASGRDCLLRIFRDTRFSKDKSPYKNYWGGSFKRATKKLRGGYYFHLQPGASFAAGGFFSPNPVDLLRIRKDIELNYDDWEKLLLRKSLVVNFGELQGEKIKTVPRGFSKDHPGIEILKHKQYYFKRVFSDKEVLNPGFLQELNNTFKNLRPYFDYMSNVLGTDLNGVSIV